MVAFLRDVKNNRKFQTLSSESGRGRFREMVTTGASIEMNIVMEKWYLGLV